MATKVVISFQGVGDAMRQPEIRAALRTRADSIASRARGFYAADLRMSGETVDVVEGTNAKGRPYARVTSTAVASEHGTSREARRRVLGRAAEGSN